MLRSRFRAARWSASSDRTAPAKHRSSTSSPAPYTANSGSILLDGGADPPSQAAPDRPPRHRADVPEYPALLQHDGVGPSARVAAARTLAAPPCPAGVLGQSRRHRTRRGGARILWASGIPSPHCQVAFPYGIQRRVEMARAVTASPKLLLLDEPVAGMNNEESEELRGLLTRLRETGLTILLIEHDMPFVMQVCDYLHVLDFGEVIAEGDPAVGCATIQSCSTPIWDRTRDAVGQETFRPLRPHLCRVRTRHRGRSR